MLEPVRLVSEEPAPASATLHKRLGMNQACAAHRLAQDLSRATQPTRASVHADPSFSPAVMMVEDMHPKNSAEALIASQLVALTPLMLEAVGQANMADTAQGKVLWAGEAVKLARTSAQLADTLARLQRGGEQRVIIERVEVRDGGQAVVGVVHRSEARGVSINEGSTPMSSESLCPNAVPKCGARTRSGGACGRLPMAGKKRCDMHGGKSPGAPKGNQNALRHGYWSAVGVAFRRRIDQAVGRARRSVQ